jgi:hypothetical protein
LPGKKFHLAVDDVVALLGEPVDEFGGLFRLHELKRPGRNKLHVGAVVAHVIQMAFGPVFFSIGRGANLVVRYIDAAAPVRSAGGKQVRLVSPQFDRGGHMAVYVDNHGSRSSIGF